MAYEGRPAAAAAVPAGVSAGLRATPLARRVAAERGVDLGAVAGSGLNGKVVRSDLDGIAAAAAVGTVIGRNGDKKIAAQVPYSGVRRIIGERLAESKFTAPHLYFTQKVDVTALLDLRARVNARQEKKTSVTDYIARAVVLALQAHPELNASLAGDVIEQYANVNLGIAVAAPGGLIVPVVKDAETLSVSELSKRASTLVEKARTGKLLPDEYTGGTFTISNLGMFGIENFTAILNPPESGILAVSATKDEAAVTLGADGTKRIEIRPVMNITLSVDHRIIDGLLAAQFVGEVKRLLEAPVELMVQDWE
ncbi:MAG: 2-oxo acid dehydrogenase subunit E2 [Clostridiales Family XIII bacterium]|nr:2-oxo acid dehydrogenase subunit E2 [Clostridiales Family XIII bacterium]